MQAFVLRLPLQRERKREPQKPAQSTEHRAEGQVAGEYDSVFDCDYGCDGESVFLPGRRLVGVDALEKIDRLPSFLGTASCNEEEEMPNVEKGMVGSASYNRTL